MLRFMASYGSVVAWCYLKLMLNIYARKERIRW